MIYNYLELDDINKWPKDKKVMLLNLLGIKSADELAAVKVDTDYILSVETRLNNLIESTNDDINGIGGATFSGLGKKQKELMIGIVDLIKEKLDDEKDNDAYNTFKYLYYYIQAMNGSRELKYMLAYVAKAAGLIKPFEFSYDEDEQFVFESIMFSAMTLYGSGSSSKTKLAESHRRFVAQIEQRMEEKMSYTLELNTAKVQALKELGYTEINEKNAGEVLAKIADIQSRQGAF